MFAAVDGPALGDAGDATLSRAPRDGRRLCISAALWLRERDDRSVPAFGGSQRAISDYLAREVLSGFDRRRSGSCAAAAS